MIKKFYLVLLVILSFINCLLAQNDYENVYIKTVENIALNNKDTIYIVKNKFTSDSIINIFKKRNIVFLDTTDINYNKNKRKNIKIIVEITNEKKNFIVNVSDFVYEDDSNLWMYIESCSYYFCKKKNVFVLFNKKCSQL